VHDYLPEDLETLHNDLRGPLGAELLRLREQITRYIAGMPAAPAS